VAEPRERLRPAPVPARERRLDEPGGIVLQERRRGNAAGVERARRQGPRENAARAAGGQRTAAANASSAPGASPAMSLSLPCASDARARAAKVSAAREAPAASRSAAAAQQPSGARRP
jgi:hypothetical protein